MDDLGRQIEVDAETELTELTVEAAAELERLAPFGMGNPAPVLVTRGLTVEKMARVGDGSHLSLRLKSNGGGALGAIWFRAGELGEQLAVGASVDVCFRAKLDQWAGTPRVQPRNRRRVSRS
jgi:single-stranded-DNA-specific exonuclease